LIQVAAVRMPAIDVIGKRRGRPARIARDEAVRDGITINGLPILSAEPDLDTYYFENVIGGPAPSWLARAAAPPGTDEQKFMLPCSNRVLGFGLRTVAA
jgi:hypothetical protein